MNMTAYRKHIIVPICNVVAFSNRRCRGEESVVGTPHITRRFFVAAWLATVSAAALPQADYTSRPIKIVVPVPPGGFADTLPRLVAEKLAARFSQSIVIENRPGAGLNIGAEAVAKAAP